MTCLPSLFCCACYSTLKSAESYRELRQSFVIFICTDDYYKRGLAVYRRRSVIEGAEDIAYDDGSHAYLFQAIAGPGLHLHVILGAALVLQAHVQTHAVKGRAVCQLFLLVYRRDAANLLKDLTDELWRVEPGDLEENAA